MVKNKFLLAVLLLLCVVTSLAALGAKDNANKEQESQKVQDRGLVRLVGNSPFTMLVITGEDREWIVAEKEQNKLMHLQQQTVNFEGTEYYRDLTFANGMSAGRQYYLKNIKILSPYKR